MSIFEVKTTGYRFFIQKGPYEIDTDQYGKLRNVSWDGHALKSHSPPKGAFTDLKAELAHIRIDWAENVPPGTLPRFGKTDPRRKTYLEFACMVLNNRKVWADVG